jgi:hypothetical protein
MKTELIVATVDEIKSALEMNPGDRHLALTEVFSGVCLLDALHVLILASESLPTHQSQLIGRYMFDVDGVNGNEESQKAFHCEGVASAFRRRLVHQESNPDGTCDGIMLFLHNITSDCPLTDAIATAAFLVHDSKHVRNLLRRHLDQAVEENGISTICE